MSTIKWCSQFTSDKLSQYIAKGKNQLYSSMKTNNFNDNRGLMGILFEPAKDTLTLHNHIFWYIFSYRFWLWILAIFVYFSTATDINSVEAEHDIKSFNEIKLKSDFLFLLWKFYYLFDPRLGQKTILKCLSTGLGLEPRLIKKKKPKHKQLPNRHFYLLFSIPQKFIVCPKDET